MADISKIKLPDNSEYEIKDAKARMVILRYGISTWNDFITAYQNNCVIYCRASSNSNPATGSQTRLAFMAYVTDMTNPTNVEFQYYRSVNKHTDSQQGNQVYVYKLTNANKWTVTVRNTFSKVIAGDNITSSFVESETNSSITLSADYDSTVTQSSTKLITSGAVYDAIANQPTPDLADLPDVTITTPSNGDVLKYDSTNDEWVNGQGGGGASSLDDLSDVTITTPTDGQILKYDGTNQEWVNASGGGGSSDPHITLTQAEYDALVQAGTVDPTAFYFISDASFPPHTYSTTAQVVGTWVDGSLVYEKTFVINNPSTGNNTITHNISNLDMLISLDGFAKRSDGYQQPFNFISEADNFKWDILVLDFGNTDFVLQVGSNYTSTRAISKAVITLRYTKSSS